MLEIRDEIQCFCNVYRESVLPSRRRTVQLVGRKCRPRIVYSFLGYEVQAGRKRLTCPDSTTARYLMIFTELGCGDIQIPYDPSRTALLLPELERAFDAIRSRLRGAQAHEVRSAYASIRRRLATAQRKEERERRS